MNLRVYLSLLLGVVLMFSSCKKVSSSNEISSYFDSIHKADELYFSQRIAMDSTSISERLLLPLPTTSLVINGVEKKTPFMYEATLDSNPDNTNTIWHIGKLDVQDSELNIEFKHRFRINDESDMRAGRMYFIRSNDPQALTIDDLKEGLDERMLYYDKECVIFLSGKDIYAQYFKFFEDAGIYAVYYTHISYIIREEFMPVKLDYIIDDLRVVKTFFGESKLVSFKTWDEYIKAFSPSMALEVEKQRKYLSEVISGIDNKSEVARVSHYISIPLAMDTNKVWDRLHNRALNKEFVFDNGNYKFNSKEIDYWYNRQNNISVIYKDPNTIIFKYKALSHSAYSYIKKIKLGGKDFLLVDYKFIENPELWEAEAMMMYNLRMLESLPELK